MRTNIGFKKKRELVGGAGGKAGGSLGQTTTEAFPGSVAAWDLSLGKATTVSAGLQGSRHGMSLKEKGMSE